MISSGIPRFVSQMLYKVVAKASDHENVDGRYVAQIFYYDAGPTPICSKAFAEYSTGAKHYQYRQVFQLM